MTSARAHGSVQITFKQDLLILFKVLLRITSNTVKWIATFIRGPRRHVSLLKKKSFVFELIKVRCLDPLTSLNYPPSFCSPLRFVTFVLQIIKLNVFLYLPSS